MKKVHHTPLCQQVLHSVVHISAFSVVHICTPFWQNVQNEDSNASNANLRPLKRPFFSAEPKKISGKKIRKTPDRRGQAKVEKRRGTTQSTPPKRQSCAQAIMVKCAQRPPYPRHKRQSTRNPVEERLRSQLRTIRVLTTGCGGVPQHPDRSYTSHTSRPTSES